MIKKSILIWLSIIPLAILNGIFREEVLTDWLGAEYSLPISGITLSLLILIISFLFIPKLGRGTTKTYWLIGLLWVALTLLFETGMGLFMGKTFYEIVNAYDVTTGNLWLFVVLFIGCTPQLVAKFKNLTD